MNIDVRKLLALRYPERARQFAIMLSAFVDKEGYFSEYPKNLLKSFGLNEVQAKRAVDLLKEEKWLRNEGGYSRHESKWRLNVKRLGPIVDIAKEVEIQWTAGELAERFGREGTRRLVEALKERLN